MVVEAEEARLGVRLRHEDGRRAETAADVGDLGAGLELGLDAVERGEPRAGEVADVARAEEALGALEQARMLVAPLEALAGAKVVLDLRLAAPHRLRHLEETGNERRARVVGQRERLLGGQRVAAGGGS